MSFKKSIEKNKPRFMLNYSGNPIANVNSVDHKNGGLVFDLTPIYPMTAEKLIESSENVMKALMHRS